MSTKGLLNGVIFIELKKAFDTIDHEIILQKLAWHGVDQDARKWFKCYLTNRPQRCTVNNHLSSASPLNCGETSPRINNWSSTLFDLYKWLIKLLEPVGSPRMNADDTNVTFAAASGMLGLETQINTELKSINLWLRAINLNVAKTEFMVISSRQKLQSLNDKTLKC